MSSRRVWLAVAVLAAAGLCGCATGAPAAVLPSTAGSPPPATIVAPAPSSTPPPDPLQRVRQAPPTSFVLHGPAFTVRARVCAMPYVRPLDPPGEQHHTVCWVQHPFGVAPGYPASGTSYVLGHAWAEDPLEVLNPMSELAMRQVDLSRPSAEAGVPIYPVTNLDGYLITLTTATGRVVYRIDRAFAVAKDRAGNVPSVMAERTPNRLVLITCGVRRTSSGLVDADVDVIAYAVAVAATPSRG